MKLEYEKEKQMNESIQMSTENCDANGITPSMKILMQTTKTSENPVKPLQWSENVSHCTSAWHEQLMPHLRNGHLNKHSWSEISTEKYNKCVHHFAP